LAEKGGIITSLAGRKVNVSLNTHLDIYENLPEEGLKMF
jgi:hypothetical protein